MLKEGTAAPDFEGTLGDGRTLGLADYKGVKNVLAYLYL